jgi:hypothetical protein
MMSKKEKDEVKKEEAKKPKKQPIVLEYYIPNGR